ncbi:MAG: polysaccharide biosynthesis/export family protein [Opitutaceae bacterium]|jgi:polysaccharide export outer membrane protein
MSPRDYIRLLLSFVVLGSCLAQEPNSEGKAPSADKVSDYLLQPSDLLRVQVFQEEDLTREVRISQEFTITLPLIGTVDLKGKTLRQAEDLVTSLYNKDFLVNPQVTLVVTQYAKRTVDVQGQVGNPGAIEFPQEKGLSLLQAITRAGGFTRLADKKRLMLTRRLPDGSAKTFTINATEIIDGTTQDSWELQKDDSIFVPERIL